ncbi:hypothetical protein [Streptomyces sp. BK205]|uniref:hypothetical protein n=1 Tax=Streptomyces sp. BK205 TaxID=2512164 RepID=UPI0014049940|nr:hypothetical protein [Streptomyces sp. BK205]
MAALDHGLTLGNIPGIASLYDLKDTCQKLHYEGAPAVVLNAGVLRFVQPPADCAIVAQLVGMPMSGYTMENRIPLCSVEEAIALGAEAVSLQVSVDSISEDIMSRSMQLISDAHKFNLPVLLMLGPPNWASLDFFLATIRSFSEIGVDLIKVSPGRFLRTLADNRLKDFSVPLLYPGGELSKELIVDIKAASRVGYQGICIGRNFFQSEDTLSTSLPLIDQAFEEL